MTKLDPNDVIDLLLYFASGEGLIRMPFEWERVTMEIVAGLYEYSTEKHDFPEKFRGTGFRFEPINYKTDFNRFVMTMLADTNEKLEPSHSLWLVFVEMFKLSWRDRSSPVDDGYCTNKIRDWRQTYVAVGQRSGKTFVWSVPEAARMRKEIEQDFNSEVVRHCQSIANLMKKWVQKDIDELKQNSQYR
ncbi:hypothetical protein KW791_03135 [Candidatus Parcubacteria bacterium]|nr:hypothetical protein [Candidatus Parcubacteria bacterium]